MPGSVSGQMPGQQSDPYRRRQVGRGTGFPPAPPPSQSLSIFNVPTDKRNFFHAFQAFSDKFCPKAEAKVRELDYICNGILKMFNHKWQNLR